MELDEFLANRNPKAVSLFLEFRAIVLSLGPVQERVHRTEVAWADQRVFADAFTLSDRLEVAIHLLRRVEHPQLLQAFPTTRKVMTHRLSITAAGQLDDTIEALLAEALDTVGPGTR
ncbi:DUF5655 domain-containing protein [Arthrobacter sulfonylureivorans]|uniref:DUF5655 domain-containing protein n=1 Tax=Arthrobacter sulfonylureivorans TaxID=2486855 RepID=A0ABY3WC26_9MICC|nr:DUF5655 domain-containing protein [Arthrobacter sulfonylureivorans]UNK45842.1 DUF5655 domain-containing protein [Arthrobacter sulfonylureivorans]